MKKNNLKEKTPFNVTFKGVEKRRRRNLASGGTEISLTRKGRLKISATVGGTSPIDNFSCKSILQGFEITTEVATPPTS